MNDNVPTKEAAVAGQPPKNASTKTRSPAYPAFDLETALKRAATIWENAKTHPVDVKTAAGYWDLPAKSSATLLCIATLKKFGFVDELEKGTDQARAFKLTEFGIRLIYNPDTESEEYKQGLKRAALLPTIHTELWEKYKDNWPDDKVIERYLVLDRKFNQNYVAPFIEQFKRTIAFANLSDSDTVVQQNDNVLKTNAESKSSQAASGLKWGPVYKFGDTGGEPSRKGNQSVNIGAITGEIPLFLGDGRFVKIPTPLTEEDFTFLVELLNSYKSRLVKASISSSIKLPANATWENADNDKPVKIVKFLGERNGEQFYLSEDGTGIPASELKFD